MLFHPHEMEIIVNAVKSGRLSHAYIIEGAQGVGKYSFALRAAKAILCESAASPCDKCNICKKITAGTHPDVHIFKGEESGAFKVESVREMIKSVYYTPNEGKKKVYILDDAHKMTSSAQNALLKVFEEPPESAVFFILTQKRDALLSTVISRGQIISLPPLSAEAVTDFLKNKYPKKDPALIETAARISGGLPGAALKNMDKSSVAEREKAKEFAALLFSGKHSDYNILTFFLPNKAKRESILCFFDAFLYLLRDIIYVKANCGESVFLTPDTAQTYANGQTLEALQKLSECTQNCYTAVEKSGNIGVTLADYCVTIKSIEKDKING